MRTNTILLTCAIALGLAAAAPAQNLFKQRKTRVNLTADNVARDVGDILSIVIQERSKVKNEDKTERDSTTSLRAQIEAFSLSDKFFKTNVLPELDVRSARSFGGEAKQEKDSNFEARMAVMIVDVMPNGNLVIAGSRMLEVDDEVKTMRISGVVRPLDIASDNAISSAMVAEARVSMTGEGGNTRMNTRGPVGTLFDTLIWAAWPF